MSGLLGQSVSEEWIMETMRRHHPEATEEEVRCSIDHLVEVGLLQRERVSLDPVHVKLLAVTVAARTLHALLTAKPPHASYSATVREALQELGVALGVVE